MYSTKDLTGTSKSPLAMIHLAHDCPSLHATFLRNRIIGALRSDPDLATQTAQSVSQSFVFEHPTLHELALVIVALVGSGSSGVVRTAEQQIIDMIEKYAAGLPTPAYTPAHTNGVARDTVVLLTGSTGNVGSQLLASMLANSMFDKIYTLNRGSAHIHDRQKVAFEERGLDSSLLDDPRLTQLVGEVTKKNFGLALEAFAEVRRLHLSAWRRAEGYPPRSGTPSRTSYTMPGVSTLTLPSSRSRPMFLARAN